MSSAPRPQIDVHGAIAAESISARSIVLCDHEGNCRAALEVRGDGAVVLQLLDASEQPRVQVEVAADGTARAVQCDAAGASSPLRAEPAKKAPPLAPAIRGPLAREITPLPDDVFPTPPPNQTPAPRESTPPPPVEKPFRTDSILP